MARGRVVTLAQQPRAIRRNRIVWLLRRHHRERKRDMSPPLRGDQRSDLEHRLALNDVDTPAQSPRAHCIVTSRDFSSRRHCDQRLDDDSRWYQRTKDAIPCTSEVRGS